MSAVVYKIVPSRLWSQAVSDGVFRGSAVDDRDGFIHFSSAAQVQDTAARHFAGASDLLLVAVPAAALGAALRWEPSRDGALFPHLYGVFQTSAASWVTPLPLVDGQHRFPDLDLDNA